MYLLSLLLDGETRACRVYTVAVFRPWDPPFPDPNIALKMATSKPPKLQDLRCKSASPGSKQKLRRFPLVQAPGLHVEMNLQECVTFCGSESPKNGPGLGAREFALYGVASILAQALGWAASPAVHASCIHHGFVLRVMLDSGTSGASGVSFFTRPLFLNSGTSQLDPLLWNSCRSGTINKRGLTLPKEEGKPKRKPQGTFSWAYCGACRRGT